MDPKCETCAAYDPYGEYDGWCRRRTPLVDEVGNAYWPTVRVNSWCLEYVEKDD
jgi:hypothetical protein